ncbi:MAG: transposase [Sulfurospirillum sp.]|nr:transposase [Sulfurospirillum sp.]
MINKHSCLFLDNFISHFPFKIRKILTDNGAQFSYRLTQFRHPWTNGLVERINRTIKEATVKIYFYETLKELKEHLMIWLLMYNFEKKLKSLEYESPYDIIIKEFDIKPSNFYINPTHKKVGLNT